jgi:cyclophilin family peptidyl-prolyl cis-trans isomerase/HEAT repeat protein
VAVALAAGVCAVSFGAQTSRPSTGSREATLPVILSIEGSRAPTRSDLDVLLAATRGSSGQSAIRALGRLERRDVITDLLPFLAAPATRAAAATAVGLALRGPALDGVPHGQQEGVVLEALIAAGDMELSLSQPAALAPVARALGRLAVEDVDSFKRVEAFLRSVLERRFPSASDAPHITAARGLESLARLRRKVAALDEETLDRLRGVARSLDPGRAEHQRNALAALIAAQGVDADTLRATLTRGDAQVRRLAVLALSGSGSVIDEEERVGSIRRALADASHMVRFEAVRAWVRRGVTDHGCQPLLDVLSDQSVHVVLAALDALGDVCRDDASVTIRLASEARSPRPQGRWQREMHAFVALAKRDRERAGISMLAFAMHPTWQVRMYTARAAAIVDDAAVLARLASDPEDNVAEAALTPLRRLIGAESDQLFVDVLNRRTRTVLRNAVRPYEVIRTAAMALENAASTPALVAALAGALERITAEQCETSRDTRIALINRLAQLGSPAQASTLTPLLRDVDPKVATAAAQIITQWTGKVVTIDTPPQRSADIPTAEELTKLVRLSFEMDSGRRFDVSLNPGEAPLARKRILAAVRAGYYNNLTFHRVVPNFIIQGGSPGANEYCGDCPFMRDEVGGMHVRGTIGISTRGPDTGDAQIFINLVDNPRLDFDYTVFARVCTGMGVVDEIVEGDRIADVAVLPPTDTCGG